MGRKTNKMCLSRNLRRQVLYQKGMSGERVNWVSKKSKRGNGSSTESIHRVKKNYKKKDSLCVIFKKVKVFLTFAHDKFQLKNTIEKVISNYICARVISFNIMIENSLRIPKKCIHMNMKLICSPPYLVWEKYVKKAIYLWFNDDIQAKRPAAI